jgi:hypothetical protein
MTAVHRGCQMASVQDASTYTDGDGVRPERTLWDRFAGGTKCQYSGMIVTADFRMGLSTTAQRDAPDNLPEGRCGHSQRRSVMFEASISSSSVALPGAYEYAPHREDL